MGSAAGSTSAVTSIESRDEFEKTPRGQYDYWQQELSSSLKSLEKWHKQADKIQDRYLGKRKVSTSANANAPFDLNLFHSNVKTLTSMLYGNAPKIDVARRYADPDDDVARVASNALERILNMDVAEHGAEIDAVLKATLQDRMLPGLGVAKLRYTVETGMETDPATGQKVETLITEDAPIDYFYWGDVAWGWARTFAELPWIGFKNYLTKDEIAEKFGKLAADNIPLSKQTISTSDEDNRDPELDSPWEKGEVWEIWDKKTRKVIWLALGYNKVLKTQDDPLQLQAFWPCPPFFIANPTTKVYIPTPDFVLAQDLYNSVDVLQERINIITQAVKVVGVYDKSNAEIQQMFKSGMDNDLIPVDNWALFGEKGGLKGQIDWVPLGDIVAALEKLVEMRNDSIQLLQQITGMSDIMRGGLDSPYEGVGQSEMKAKFGSIQIQALQDQFAQFASDMMQIKAEIISRHFSPETIARRSNLGNTVDAELLPQAIALIKQPEVARLRVSIRPESVAMVDYAQLKRERTDFLNAIATFMQASAPLMEADPNATPFVLQLLQWGMAGFKGSQEIEGVVDKAIKKASEPKDPNQEQQDPKVQALQLQQQLEQAKAQAELSKIQAKAQADMQLRQQDLQADMQTQLNAHQTKMAEIQAQMEAKMAEIQGKMQADIIVEEAQSRSNAMQAQQVAGTEVQKDVINHQLNMDAEAQKTANKITEIAAASSAKIKEGRLNKPTGGSDE